MLDKQHKLKTKHVAVYYDILLPVLVWTIESLLAREIQILYRKIFQIVTTTFHLKY